MNEWDLTLRDEDDNRVVLRLPWKVARAVAGDLGDYGHWKLARAPRDEAIPYDPMETIRALREYTA